MGIYTPDVLLGNPGFRPARIGAARATSHAIRRSRENLHDKWTYCSFYRVEGHQLRQWSADATVTVSG